jgi:hypothetical protein
MASDMTETEFTTKATDGGEYVVGTIDPHHGMFIEGAHWQVVDITGGALRAVQLQLHRLGLSVGAIHHGDTALRARLHGSLVQVGSVLQHATIEAEAAAETLVAHLKLLIEQLLKPRPNRAAVQASISGALQAAEALDTMLPGLSSIVRRINELVGQIL